MSRSTDIQIAHGQHLRGVAPHVAQSHTRVCVQSVLDCEIALLAVGRPEVRRSKSDRCGARCPGRRDRRAGKNGS